MSYVPFTPVNDTPSTSAPALIAPTNDSASSTAPATFSPGGNSHSTTAPAVPSLVGDTPASVAPTLPFEPGEVFWSSAALQTRSTVGVTPGASAFVYVSTAGVRKLYVLSATTASGAITPSDFNGSTNVKYWVPATATGPTSFTPANDTASTTAPSGFTPANDTPSSTAPVPLSPTGNSHSVTAPGAFTPANDTASTAAPTIIAPSGNSRSSTAPSLITPANDTADTFAPVPFSPTGNSHSSTAPVAPSPANDTASTTPPNTFPFGSTYNSVPSMPAAFIPAFTALTGAGAALASLNASTTDATNGLVLEGIVGGTRVAYQVRAGTDAQSLPGIVRPANFDAVNNAVVFVEC